MPPPFFRIKNPIDDFQDILPDRRPLDHAFAKDMPPLKPWGYAEKSTPRGLFPKKKALGGASFPRDGQVLWPDRNLRGPPLFKAPALRHKGQSPDGGRPVTLP